MSASPRLFSRTTAALLLAALGAWLPATARAQYENHCGPFCAGIEDYQYFEPVDLDLDCQPIRFDCGWQFSYEKVAWFFTGERTTIGSTNPAFRPLSEQIYVDNNPGFPDIITGPINDNRGNQNDAPDPYLVDNDIKNAPPRAEMGQGDRYEIGYMGEDGRGFMLGFLHEVEATHTESYGFGAPLNGFGSVHVVFETPPDYLLGFRDYGTNSDLDVDGDNDNFDPPIEGTTNGPGGTVGQDGEIDNIDGDLVGGPFVLLFGGVPVGFGYDFDDLHLFNIRFSNMIVRNHTRTDGVELMQTVELDNRHYMAKHQNQRLQVGYGVRYMRLKDEFAWGGFIDGVDGWGRTFASTKVDNNLVGPQIRLRWNIQKAKWHFALDGRFMAGYNIQNTSLVGGFGENIITGGLNNSAVAQPTYTATGRQDENFSPLVELRAETRYLLTRSISFKLGYTATFVDNITRGSQVTRYTLPNYTLSGGGNQEIFYSGVNFGVEIWH